MARKTHPSAPRVTVDVDVATIEASVPRDSSHCMIAEAVKASLPGMTHISVDLQTIRFSDPAKRLRYVYLTPRAAQLALIRFDSGTRPEPFSMRLQGGQVTAMSKSSAWRRMTPEQQREQTTKQRQTRQQEQRYLQQETGQGELSLDEEQQQARALSKPVLVNEGSTDHQPPTVVGGRRPPRMSFARRRTFGLRALERLDPSGVATMTP